MTAPITKFKNAARPSGPSAENPPQPNAAAASSAPPLHPTIQRAIQMIERGDYQPALQLLRSHGQDRETLNATGVCLMRMGQTQEAIKLFRSLVLMPGCTWMRPELPTRYKTNFATALLLGGHPAGCLDMLEELKHEASPTVERLRAAVKRWEASLGFWRRLDWRLCRVEPENLRVELDFVPGEFTDPPSAAESRP